jgi:hypothetical protein
MTGLVDVSHMSSPVRVLQCDLSGTIPRYSVQRRLPAPGGEAAIGGV